MKTSNVKMESLIYLIEFDTVMVVETELEIGFEFNLEVGVLKLGPAVCIGQV